jgi:hypothetical protein
MEYKARTAPLLAPGAIVTIQVEKYVVPAKAGHKFEYIAHLADMISQSDPEQKRDRSLQDLS